MNSSLSGKSSLGKPFHKTVVQVYAHPLAASFPTQSSLLLGLEQMFKSKVFRPIFLREELLARSGQVGVVGEGIRGKRWEIKVRGVRLGIGGHSPCRQLV